MTASTIPERLGLDAARLGFTLRTAIAACCALFIAWLLGLEHPQWSAMTVWAASQPVRGQLVEKSLFRALGTVLGAIFGMGLLLASHGWPWVIVPGLALWIGLCAGAGNILRGFASYGAMLAGYSAAMVTLLHSAQSASPLAVGVDRMLTVLLGLLVALAIGWVFAAPGDDPDDLTHGPRRLSRRILADLASCLAGKAPPDHAAHHVLLSGMAAIEDRLDGRAAGSLRSREAVRAVRRLLLAQVAILLWMRRPLRRAENGPLAAALREAAEAYNEPCRPQDADAALHRAAGLAAFDPVLQGALADLTTAAARERAAEGAWQTAGTHAAALHRDWIGARQALLRTMLAILAVGGIWLATDWEAGAFMLLGTAIMTTVFSTADNPVRLLRQVIVGQALGVAGALACRWLVWPLAGGETGLVLSMMPFIVFGGFLFAHRRASGPIGFDYNMVVLLLLQPVWPLTGSFPHSLMAGVAVVLGPAIGLVAFRLIFPVDGKRRLRTLVAMMVREIEAMAGRRGASRRRPVWRARLYHRLLRLVRWADKTGADKEEAVEGSFAILLLGSAILHLDSLLQQPELAPGAARRLDMTLARLRRVGRDPHRAARALAATAASLAGNPAVDTGLLREAAAELSSRAAFLQPDTRART